VSADYSAPVDGEIPLLVGFYDPSVYTYRLSFVRLAVMRGFENLLELADEMRERFGLLPDEKLRAFYWTGSSGREVEITNSLAEQNVHSGFIAFQSLRTTTKKPIPETLKLFRACDFIPEHECTTVDRFLEIASSSEKFVIAHRDSPELDEFRIAIPLSFSMASFLRCIRAVVGCDAKDSVFLFLESSGGRARPSETPITILDRATIQQVVPGKIVFYKIMNGITQEELMNKVLLKLVLCDDRLRVIDTPIFLMDKGRFTSRDVIRKVREKGLASDGVPYRLLQLRPARIVKELEADVDISQFSREDPFRAEVIPEDQRGIPECEKVRVTLTHDFMKPRMGCFGIPFIFRVIKGEKFSDTKQRLLEFAEISGVDREKAMFKYTNDSLSESGGCKVLKPDDVLADCLEGRNTMVFVWTPGGVARSGSGNVSSNRYSSALRIFS
jgi:hypothetical protein